MGNDGQPAVIGLWSRRPPDVTGLARRRVAEARQTLGMELDQFAKTLGTVLDWEPSPQAIESWEEVATPPGDMIAGVHALGSLGVVEYLRENLAALWAEVGSDPLSMVVASRVEGTTVQEVHAAWGPKRHG